MFSDDDFDNLSNIGESAKQFDGSTTGKYGRGFCSVYNWTDLPCILSRNNLLILDPHQSWPESSGGNTYDIVESATEPAMQNHLSAFKPFVEGPLKEPFSGTIIRLPLRTAEQAKKSLIVQHETTIDEVSEVLKEFARDFGRSGLLFLKNVEKFCIEMTHEQPISFEVINPEVRERKDKINEAVRRSLQDPNYIYEDSFIVVIRYTHGEESLISTFVVSHTIRNPSSTDLRSWSTKHRMASWVAVAIPLDSNTSVEGRLFSCLPLPVPTIQMAYLHGLFPLSPDRARLHRKGDTSSHHADPGLWNEWLCEGLVPQAWSKLLIFLAERKTPSERFDTWWPIASQDPHDPLYKLLELVFTKIENQAVWPTCKGFIKAHDGYLKGNESLELHKALEAALVPVIYMPSNLRAITHEMFKNHQLSPRSLCQYLVQRQDNAILCSLSETSKLALLEYLIKGQSASYGCLPLFPYEDGEIRAINGCEAFVHRDSLDADLFSCGKSSNIDMQKLSTKARDTLRSCVRASSVHRALQFRSLGDFYCYLWNFVIPGRTENPTLMQSHQATMITKAWSWITLHNIDLLDERIANLPLIPLGKGYHRKIKPNARNWPLAYAPANDLGELVRKISGSAPVLTPGSMDSKARDLLLKAARKSTNLDIYDARRLPEFLTWLNRLKLRENSKETTRKDIIEHIVNQLRLGDWPERDLVSDALRQIPLFRKLIWKNKEPPEWAWSKIGAGTMISVGLKDGLLCIPELVSYQFFDAAEMSGKLLTELGLAKALSTPEVLKLVIEAWNRGEDAQWSNQVKIGTAKLILSNYWYLSGLTEVIGSLPMIPTTSLNMQPSMGGGQVSDDNHVT